MVAGNAVVDVLARSDLLVGISRKGQDVSVAGIMRREFLKIQSALGQTRSPDRISACGA